jgi:hypothetical protein
VEAAWHALRNRRIVRYDDDSESISMDFTQQVDDLLRIFLIEIAGWLVAE